MNNKNWINLLYNLCQLDIDAVKAYDQALKHIDNDLIHSKIKSFQYDHMQHIEELSSLIRRYGGKPPSFTLDFEGYLIEGVTFLRSLTGMKGALQAMENNEKTAAECYRDAMSDINLPADILLVLNKNYNDEQLHLRYIQETLHHKAA